MRIFISWSGERSRAIADIIRKWLPSVLQAVRPYFSPDDLSKGSRWNSEIAKELEASRVGLLILTPENQSAPWMIFEAGALGKNLERSKVCPLLFGGLEPTDVKGPLVQFQASKFNGAEMKRLVKMINAELGDTALASEVLDSVFEMWWPKLLAEVEIQLEQHEDASDEAARTDRDLLEEVLGLVRNIARESSRRYELEHPAYDELVARFTELARIAREEPASLELVSALKRAVRPLRMITRSGVRSDRGRRMFRQIDRLFIDLDSLLEGAPPALEANRENEIDDAP